jgi:hypothetical protein
VNKVGGEKGGRCGRGGGVAGAAGEKSRLRLGRLGAQVRARDGAAACPSRLDSICREHKQEERK